MCNYRLMTERHPTERIPTAQQELSLLTERETARRLGVSSQALRRWRSIGAGPPWLRIGFRLVRYDLGALRRWVEERAGVRDGQ